MDPNVSDALVAEIQTALGPRGWLDPADAGPVLTGWRGTYSGTPVLVARPDTVDGVQEVVRSCVRHGAVVVTQGGNTGLAGGSVPIDAAPDGRPSVLLLTTRLNRITSVDPARFTVTAEAGCTVEQVQQAAAAVDRQLTMDWGARGTATVGGAISTNAGGLNVLRYGNTRHHVLGIEAVLADGRVFDGLRALRKDNTGYDLKHLFIGAEGTLGVVTRAVLELQPAMPHHRSLFAALADLDNVTDLYGLARSIDPGGLTAFELVPEMGVGVAVDVLDVVRPIDTRAEWYLLARFSGSEPVTDTVTRFLTEAVESGYATDAVVAETASQESTSGSCATNSRPRCSSTAGAPSSTPPSPSTGSPSSSARSRPSPPGSAAPRRSPSRSATSATATSTSTYCPPSNTADAWPRTWSGPSPPPSTR